MGKRGVLGQVCLGVAIILVAHFIIDALTDFPGPIQTVAMLQDLVFPSVKAGGDEFASKCLQAIDEELKLLRARLPDGSRVETLEIKGVASKESAYEYVYRWVVGPGVTTPVMLDLIRGTDVGRGIEKFGDLNTKTGYVGYVSPSKVTSKPANTAQIMLSICDGQGVLLVALGAAG
jgi:hypothetical protein